MSDAWAVRPWSWADAGTQALETPSPQPAHGTLESRVSPFGQLRVSCGSGMLAAEGTDGVEPCVILKATTASYRFLTGVWRRQSEAVRKLNTLVTRPSR